MKSNNNNNKKIFWCFNCNKEVDSEYNKEEDCPQCSKCKSTFIEEIESNENDNPKILFLKKIKIIIQIKIKMKIKMKKNL